MNASRSHTLCEPAGISATAVLAPAWAAAQAGMHQSLADATTASLPLMQSSNSR